MQEDIRVTEAKLENEKIRRDQIIEMHELQKEHWEFASRTLAIRENLYLESKLIELKFEAGWKYEVDKAAMEKIEGDDDLRKEFSVFLERRYKEKLELIKKYSENHS